MATADEIHSKFVHLADVVPRPGFLRTWEKRRHRQAHWLVEMVAEATGVFIYVFAGVGANLAWNIGTLGKLDGVGSLFSVAVGYAIGIVFAITLCASTSGGHFNPGVTIAFAIWKGFPAKKIPQYIFAQLLGGYLAMMIIYAQYKDLIHQVEAGLAAAGVLEEVNFTPQGIAGCFALYAAHGANLSRILLNEFVCAFLLGLVIWGCLDPTNFFTPPFLIPIIVASGYAMAIIGYAPVGIALNSARDLPGRFAAMTIWGTHAWGGNYAAIAGLVNIPATILAAVFYEYVFTDSSRVIVPSHREFMEGHRAHMEHTETRYVSGAQADFDTASERSKSRV